ncbi:CPBP family intramembrane metalloprotease [Chitinophaga oryziterrae]|uniref:CPBP family intramembrane metalloprotease n=1 Tax=Chitinophaga oryziterrae TaxID=1031224 RepID=A0A6N8J9I7_9BACT|nr:type II CAAX endopeptidase family protein [Chitinophaga oryziterrae]MVT41178.1 CPBP family intramembrane metalloprotease [Chitinophaga oryziterrae]
MNQPVNQTRKAIFLFLFFTFAISSIFYAEIIHTGKVGSAKGLFVTGLMWSPALSAFITSLLLKRKISDLAWKWGNPTYQLWSYLTPLLYTTLAYLIIWLTGWGGFYNKEFVKQIAESFGAEHLPGPVVILLYFILYSFFGMVRSMATATGEEIGWRGFLVPELYKITGYTQTSLITGFIWALWHVPILLFADYNSGTPAWYGLSCFAVMVISSSFIFTWFRLKSGSLWTGVLLHASHNLFIQTFFTPLTVDTGKTKYFYDEFGVVLPVITSLLAIYFWSRRGELKSDS